MQKLLGVLGILAGVIFGIYIGLWLFFIGGIMGLITATVTLISGGGILAGLIAVSIIKIMLAGLAGYLSAFVIIFPSYVLLKSGK